MSKLIGLDIGGTKIAGILLDNTGMEISRAVLPTPTTYVEFISSCTSVVKQLHNSTHEAVSVGVGIPGVMDKSTGNAAFVSNIEYLTGKNLQRDLEQALQRPLHIANDANCAALSEAIDGSAQFDKHVFGLILGTGVGGGLVINKKIYEGAHGMAAEIGHLPLPFRAKGDGPLTSCNCGQYGCIDKTISGPGLENFYLSKTGHYKTAEEIAQSAEAKDMKTVEVLDHFYTLIAKAMVSVVHAYDPEIIVVSGGISSLPGLIEKVPAKWGDYIISQKIRTRFVKAKFGALTGLRGAAWLGKTP